MAHFLRAGGRASSQASWAWWQDGAAPRTYAARRWLSRRGERQLVYVARTGARHPGVRRHAQAGLGHASTQSGRDGPSLRAVVARISFRRCDGPSERRTAHARAGGRPDPGLRPQQPPRHPCLERSGGGLVRRLRQPAAIPTQHASSLVPVPALPDPDRRLGADDTRDALDVQRGKSTGAGRIRALVLHRHIRVSYGAASIW